MLSQSVNKIFKRDRPQYLREQELMKFRRGEVNVVVSTDVCSRGLDIKELDHVINYDLPEDICTYIQRNHLYILYKNESRSQLCPEKDAQKIFYLCC